MQRTTKPVPADLTYEQYCAAIGVDVSDARCATVTRALWAMLGGPEQGEVESFVRLALKPAKLPIIVEEPSGVKPSEH